MPSPNSNPKSTGNSNPQATGNSDPQSTEISNPQSTNKAEEVAELRNMNVDNQENLNNIIAPYNTREKNRSNNYQQGGKRKSRRSHKKSKKFNKSKKSVRKH
jgi:hypothetical protein